MKTVRIISIACLAAWIAACSTMPTSPGNAPATAAAPIADISGAWIMTVQTPTGGIDSTMTVVQTGSAIKGTLSSAMGTVDYTGSIEGKEVKFSYSVDQFGAPPGTTFDYVGLLEGGVMSGMAKFSSFGEGEWTAKRP